MGTNQLKAPPVFKNDDDYISWKNDIEVWQIFRDMEAKKRRLVAYLSFTGEE